LGAGLILEGITRASVLEMARERLRGELEVVERTFTIFELISAIQESRVIEAFAAGTAVSSLPSYLLPPSPQTKTPPS
jgi:branched-chain amino acid aminotransferase